MIALRRLLLAIMLCKTSVLMALQPIPSLASTINASKPNTLTNVHMFEHGASVPKGYGPQSVSFGRSKTSSNALSSGWVARPGFLEKNAESTGHVGAMAKNGGFSSEYSGEQYLIKDPSEAVEEIKNIGLTVINSIDARPAPLKCHYPNHHEAIIAIVKYMEKFEDNKSVIGEGLRALRQITFFNPASSSHVQINIYGLLQRDSTRKIYYDIVQNDARRTFSNFDIKPFLDLSKIFKRDEIPQFWEDFLNHKSEEKLVDEMEKIFKQRLDSYPKEFNLVDPWKCFISIFFAIIQEAKSEKIEMFEMLYRFSMSQSLSSDYNHLRSFIMTGEKIIAKEACRRLAMTSDVLMKHYQILLERRAFNTLSKTRAEEFFQHMAESGNSEAKLLYAELSSPGDASTGTLRVWRSTLKNLTSEVNDWEQKFELFIQVLFFYGNSLVGDNLQIDGTFKETLEILKELDCPEVTLEKRVLSRVALENLQLLLKERSLDSSEVLAASYVNSLAPHLEQFEILIENFFKDSKNNFLYVGDLTDDQRKTLNTIKQYQDKHDDEVGKLIPKLFVDSPTDQKYEILNMLKTSINQQEPEIIQNGNLLSSKNWRQMLIISLAAERALQLNSFSNFRFFIHTCSLLKDLTHTSSIGNKRIAQVALQTLQSHFVDSKLFSVMNRYRKQA